MPDATGYGPSPTIIAELHWIELLCVGDVVARPLLSDRSNMYTSESKSYDVHQCMHASCIQSSGLRLYCVLLLLLLSFPAIIYDYLLPAGHVLLLSIYLN